MTSDSACLGIEILGRCSYDPSAPSQSYFTIGQLVSVIALLLAFSQLTKPIIKFRIEAHKIDYKRPIIFCVLSIVSIFLASILPFLPGKAWPLLGYPVFWEVLAGLMLVGVAGRLLFAISKKASFGRQKAEAYLKACESVIAKGSDDDLRELADEIHPAIKPIIDECNSYSPVAARAAEAHGQEYHLEKATRTAFTILDLWSDRSFCRNIVCKAPATAIQIFDQLIHNDRSGVAGYALTQQLIHQAFVNRDSILMREEDYSGLGFFKQFRNTVFKEWRFIEGTHRPLQAWASNEEEVHSWQVKKYTECLEASFLAYFVAKEFCRYPASLSVGLGNLVHLAIKQIGVVRNTSEQDLYPSNVFAVLREVESGLERIVEIVEKSQGQLPDYQMEEDNYDRFKDHSIYMVVAYSIYEYFEHLAAAQRHDDWIRSHAIGIWLRVFGSSDQSKAAVEIGKRLIIHLNKKIDDNLDPEHRGYPVITRLLLSLNGIHSPVTVAGLHESLGDGFQRMFIERLKRDYQKLVIRDPEFAKRLLPEHFSYTPTRNEIRYQGRRREEVDVLKLEPAGC